MSLHGILSTGKTSLLAHQAAISVASNNTANADVVGYSKRDVQFGTRAGRSGIEIESVRRRADEWLQRRVLAEQSRLGAHASQSQGLRALDLHLGDPEKGVGTAMDEFFATLRLLQTSPTDGQARADLLSTGQTLTEQFNVAASRLQTERTRTDEMLRSTVEQTNALLQQVADLNGRIHRSLADGGEPSADLDRRDVALDELSKQLEITTLTDADGTVTVLLAGGRSLVQGIEASQLVATEDAAYGGLSRVDLVDRSGLPADLTSTLRSGRLGGLLELRDDILSETSERLDALAYDFASAFNAVHEAGYGTDGATGRSFFSIPATPDGAAAALALAPGLASQPDWIAASTTAAQAVGGNDNLLALAGLANTRVASGGTMTAADEYAAIVASVGTVVARGEAAERQSQAQLDQLQAMRDSQTGVSIDEELIDITRFERAFQASSRIIRTVEQMYDVLLQL